MAIDIQSLKELLPLLREHGVSYFKAENLEVTLCAPVPPTAAAYQGLAEPVELPIELTDDLPSEDELQFAASGYRPE